MRTLLQQNCTRRLMVLKEVTMINFTSLYICVSIVREVQKPIYNSLFTTFHKVQHCTGYPLIQVEIASHM